jgi:hypothetical protein
MSSYPSSIDSFGSVVDAVDTVQASDINDLRRAVEEVETQVGIEGSKVWYTDANGVLADGTDQTANLLALIQTVYTAGGGTIEFGHGTYRLDGQIVMPYTLIGEPTRPYTKGIRLTGQGQFSRGTSVASILPSSGTILDCRTDNAVGTFASYGFGGTFEIDHLTFFNGGANTAPFLTTTFTTIHIHDCAFWGLKGATSKDNIQDAIIMGGTDSDDFYSADADSSFQGYQSVIENCWFEYIRRGIYAKANVNSCTFQNNSFWAGCGGEAAIELIGYESSYSDSGNWIAGNLIEIHSYKYGIKLTNYCFQNVLIGNGMYDPGEPPWPIAYYYCAGTGVSSNFILPSMHQETKTYDLNAKTFTVDIASPCTITMNEHGLAAGNIIIPTTTGALPSGMIKLRRYYVLSTDLTANTFKISEQYEGTPVTTTGTQSGTHTYTGRVAMMLEGASTWGVNTCFIRGQGQPSAWSGNIDFNTNAGGVNTATEAGGGGVRFTRGKGPSIVWESLTGNQWWYESVGSGSKDTNLVIDGTVYYSMKQARTGGGKYTWSFPNGNATEYAYTNQPYSKIATTRGPLYLSPGGGGRATYQTANGANVLKVGGTKAAVTNTSQAIVAGVVSPAADGTGVLPGDINEVTSDDIAKAVALPYAIAGTEVTVIEVSGIGFVLWPQLTDQIDALGLNASYAFAASKTVTFRCAVAGQWRSLSN